MAYSSCLVLSSGTWRDRGEVVQDEQRGGRQVRDLQVVLGLDDEAPAGPDDAGAGQGKVLG